MTYLAQAAVAAFISALLILVLGRPAQRWKMVDVPGGRKRHGSSVPVTGGIGITAGFILALLISFGSFGEYIAFFSGFLLLALTGVLDDIGEISPGSKMLSQLLAALFMTSWGANFLLLLGDLFGRGTVHTHHWAIPLTVFATLAVINAVNMFDGLDGLAGGLSLVIIAFLGGFAWVISDPTAAKILLVLAGAIAGFLLFNLPWSFRGRHRTFMGDAGSMVLGFAIAWFSVSLTQRSGLAVPPPVMLWILGIVLMDVFTVTVRRVARRRSPMSADRDHIHHLLMRRGYSAQKTLAILIGSNTALAATGTALWLLSVPEQWIFWLFIVICAVYLVVFFMPFRLYRFRSRVARGDDD